MVLEFRHKKNKMGQNNPNQIALHEIVTLSEYYSVLLPKRKKIDAQILFGSNTKLCTHHIIFTRTVQLKANGIELANIHKDTQTHTHANFFNTLHRNMFYALNFIEIQ